MVFVVEESTRKILNRCDAWETDSDLKMADWAEENGYTILKSEITSMGDMLIWVEK